MCGYWPDLWVVVVVTRDLTFLELFPNGRLFGSGGMTWQTTLSTSCVTTKQGFMVLWVNELARSSHRDLSRSVLLLGDMQEGW